MEEEAGDDGVLMVGDGRYGVEVRKSLRDPSLPQQFPRLQSIC